MTIPSSSIEYVPAHITGTYTIVMTVHMAIVPADIEPASGDWKAAEWDGVDGDAAAKIRIGTGTTIGALDEGLYGIWVKVTAPPEVPVINAGLLRIT